MSGLNKANAPARTLEGGKAGFTTDEQALRRAVLSTLLWEDQFYENGVSIAERISQLVPRVDAKLVHDLAVQARSKYNLRHVPLLLAVESLKHGSHKKNLAGVISTIIQRPDELCEIIAIYNNQNGITPKGSKKVYKLAGQLKKGLALAFPKFNEYQFSKYDQDQKAIKLRDVLNLVHPKPANNNVSLLYKKILDQTLATPDTWEVALSAGGPSANKKDIWTRLLRENKLGALALLRNLRNMQQAGVEIDAIRDSLSRAKVERVLPFRFLSAARYAPQLEDALEQAMFRNLEGNPKLRGTTALIVDTSPSMWMAKVSRKSEMDRFEAAAALAILVREVCERANIYTFNNRSYTIPTRRGFALRDALATTKGEYSRGGLAVEQANSDGYDRIVVLTDGEWHVMRETGSYCGMESWSKHTSATCPEPLANTQRYMINVAGQKEGVSYSSWTNIEGFSEGVLGYIQAVEEVG